ncbi:MAG: hypothetical protein ACI8VT_002056, partial [Saprospiraceae bacterium]
GRSRIYRRQGRDIQGRRVAGKIGLYPSKVLFKK